MFETRAVNAASSDTVPIRINRKRGEKDAHVDVLSGVAWLECLGDQSKVSHLEVYLQSLYLMLGVLASVV